MALEKIPPVNLKRESSLLSEERSGGKKNQMTCSILGNTQGLPLKFSLGKSSRRSLFCKAALACKTLLLPNTSHTIGGLLTLAVAIVC